MLVALRAADTGRFARKIDFLAFGSDEGATPKSAFSLVLAVDGDDGLVHDTESLTAVAIQEDLICGGMRLRTAARLGNTRNSTRYDRCPKVFLSAVALAAIVMFRL